MGYQPTLYKSPINLPEARSGKMSIKHTWVEKETPIIGMRQAYTRGCRPCKAVLKEPLRIHNLCEGKGSVWMTDLPEELNQIAEALYYFQPQGSVLVGGLGLGIVATSLVGRDGVKKITVVERSKDVIKLCRAPGYRVVRDDIFRFLKEHRTGFDCYMLDTWAGTSEMEYWATVFPLRRIIRNRWGDAPKIHCWAEDIMRGQVRRQLVRQERHWMYKNLPPSMSATEADSFMEDVGLPSWEKQYGGLVVK